MFDNLKMLNEKLEEVKKQVRATGEASLKEAFTELFEKYPELQALRWVQYTPYFNDGETCTFGVNEWSAKIDGANPTEDDYGHEGYVSSYQLKKSVIGVVCQNMKEDITNLFKLADEDVMLATFGDHAEIIATRNGFEVEEYEHD